MIKKKGFCKKDQEDIDDDEWLGRSEKLFHIGNMYDYDDDVEYGNDVDDGDTDSHTIYAGDGCIGSDDQPVAEANGYDAYNGLVGMYSDLDDRNEVIEDAGGVTEARRDVDGVPRDDEDVANCHGDSPVVMYDGGDDDD